MNIEVGKWYAAKKMKHSYQNGTVMQATEGTLLGSIECIDLNGTRWGIGAENLRPLKKGEFELAMFRRYSYEAMAGDVTLVDYQDGYVYAYIIDKVNYGDGSADCIYVDGNGEHQRETFALEDLDIIARNAFTADPAQVAAQLEAGAKHYKLANLWLPENAKAFNAQLASYRAKEAA